MYLLNKLAARVDLQKSVGEGDPEASTPEGLSLELFEDISYIMAKHADPQEVPDTPDEWLDQFETFSIYQMLLEIIELWGLNVQTQEQNADGSYETITADFRKYPCIEDSIADHSAYLLGAMNGKMLRYDGLKGCTDYKKAVQIIKNGGYATSLTYVEKLCSIIEKWKLTDYDAKDSGGEVMRWYRVRKSWADSKTQKGAYKILGNAKKCADQNPGYKVFDVDGKVVYEPKAAEPVVKVPFLVKVSISDLNIRKGPGTDYGGVQFCPVGVYTIMEVKAGQGSKAGWGRLKSGVGWISLDYTARI